MIKIRVPATSANMGPGFDALGLALDLYNTFYFEEIEEGLEILGVDEKYANENNLVYRSMLRAFKEKNYSPRGIRIKMDGQIPISRGLGSSASCIVGGVLGANQIMGNILTRDQILELIVDIEGHPDNVIPAYLGGCQVSQLIGGKIVYNSIDIKKGLKFLCLVPDFSLSTKESRGALPRTIPYGDGVFNVSRTAILVSALVNGRFDLLRYGLEDRLHQPYRGRLIKDFDRVLNILEKEKVLGFYLSGAGPSIMALVEENDLNAKEKIKVHLEGLTTKWTVKKLNLDKEGAREEII